MIVREIEDDLAILEHFDFFNDFKDTHNYLKGEIMKNDDRKEELSQAIDQLVYFESLRQGKIKVFPSFLGLGITFIDSKTDVSLHLVFDDDRWVWKWLKGHQEKKESELNLLERIELNFLRRQLNESNFEFLPQKMDA